MSNYDKTKTIFLYYPKKSAPGTDTTNNVKTFDIFLNDYVNTDKEISLEDMLINHSSTFKPNMFNRHHCVPANTHYCLRDRAFFQYGSNTENKDNLGTHLIRHQDVFLVFLYRILRSKEFEGIINLIAPFDINKKYSLAQTWISETTKSGGVLYFSDRSEVDYLPYY